MPAGFAREKAQHGDRQMRDEILELRNIETAPQETLLDAHNNIKAFLAEADAKLGELNEIRGNFEWRKKSDGS